MPQASGAVGPLDPNLYEYQFNLDGRKIADPSNDMPKPQRQVDTSLLLIPGTPPDFLDIQNGAHGTMRDETYYSTVLNKNRRVLVYTPPNYERSQTPLPVLYLYHGFWDTRYSWVTEGRLAQIVDNLLTEGKVVPMIVVVPEAHALPPEATTAIGPDFVANVVPYLTKNQQAVDDELFHDIIPFVKGHYNISDEPRERAIAGLSMGGLQSIETGIVHLGYFGWIGAFSPGVISAALSEEFNNALMEPGKINKTLRLFDIISGDNDEIVGKHVTEFESRLKQANVQHVYTTLPGGTHSMFVWRPALSSFLQKIFKSEVNQLGQN
jgi:enterochelin esterase-like enzyme